MKHTLLSTIVALGAFFALTPDASARDWYVRAEVGQAAETEANGFSLSDDVAYGGALGTSIGPVRTEVGVSRITADTATVSASAVDYNATAYLDTASGLYVGAGVDYIEAEASFGPFSANDSGFGYHVTGGYARRLSDNVVGEVSARYVSADLDTVGEVETVVFSFGLRMAL